MFFTGKTTLETDGYPFHPGGVYRLSIMQSKRFEVEKLEVKLSAYEQEMYVVDRGRNSTIKFDQVYFYRGNILSETNVGDPDSDLVATGELLIPLDRRGTFGSNTHSVHWCIHVKMNIRGRPDVDERFEILVLPKGCEQ